MSYIVKLEIISEDLFGEIGELNKIAKFSCHQMKKYWAHPLSSQ